MQAEIGAQSGRPPSLLVDGRVVAQGSAQEVLTEELIREREQLARRAEAVAARTYELSELLVDVLGVEDVGASFPHRVTYHPTCH